MSLAETFAFLLSLGTRHRAITRSLLAVEPDGKEGYPLLLVEPDPFFEEVRGGLYRYRLAIQVLDRPAGPDGVFRQGVEPVEAVLTRTQQWAEQLIEGLRRERPGDLVPQGLSATALVEASTDLASGWRYEFQLDVANDVDRGQANAAYFDPALPLPPARKPLNDFSPVEISVDYLRTAELAALLGAEATPEAPAAPTNGFVDNAARRFAYTRNPRYTMLAHEYRLGTGAWVSPAINPIPFDDAAHPAGYVQVRVAAFGGVPASATLLSGAIAAAAGFAPPLPANLTGRYQPGAAHLVGAPSAVTQWSDSSGNARHLLAQSGTLGTLTVGSMQRLAFGGSAGPYLTAAGSFTAASSYSVVARLRFTAYNDAVALFGNGHALLTRAGGLGLGVFVPAQGYAIDVAHGQALGTDFTVVVAYDAATSTATLRVNDMLLGSAMGMSNMGEAFQLGAFGGDFRLRDVVFEEVATYNVALPASAQTAWHTYLSA